MANQKKREAVLVQAVAFVILMGCALAFGCGRRATVAPVRRPAVVAVATVEAASCGDEPAALPVAPRWPGAFGKCTE
jgi:hypothetical protein